jgi:hypothetical protein
MFGDNSGDLITEFDAVTLPVRISFWQPESAAGYFQTARRGRPITGGNNPAGEPPTPRSTCGVVEPDGPVVIMNEIDRPILRME